MCVQMLIGPVLSYNWLSDFQDINYRMQIPEYEYFSYAIPAVVMFILGLHVNAKTYQGEVLNQQALERFMLPMKNLPYVFIAAGFVASFFTFDVSSELTFFVYLLSDIKYVGVFIIIITGKKLRPAATIVVYGSIISSSLGHGMFHDLLTWLIFLGSVYCIKYKPNNIVKLVAAAVFILFILVVQQIKGSYRTAIGIEGKEGGIGTFASTYEEKVNTDAGFFSLENLGPSASRINQGFIISYIMRRVPAIVPFEYGSELYSLVEAAVLPRFLAPNKLRAGDRTLFGKYTGIELREGTSMALGSIGDAYLNFGLYGGMLFMFFLGLLYNEILKFLNRKQYSFPLLLIFSPIIFYYPIRPDCELQTILGHIVKSIFVIFLIMYLWKKYFTARPKTFNAEVKAIAA